MLLLFCLLPQAAFANVTVESISNQIVEHLAQKDFEAFVQTLTIQSKGRIPGIKQVAFQAKSLLKNVDRSDDVELLKHNVHIKSKHEDILHIIKFEKLALFTKMRFVKGILTSFEFDSDPMFLLGQFNRHMITSAQSSNDFLTDKIERRAAKANNLYEFSQDLLASMHLNAQESVAVKLKPFGITNFVELERKYYFGPIERRYYQIEAESVKSGEYLLYSCYLDFYSNSKNERFINRVKCDAIHTE